MKPKCHIIFILIDGLGDNGIAQLNNKTPLQHLPLTNFNAIAQAGINGVHDPVQSGLACGSDTAHLNIFGYNPFIYYNGRGAFESMGAGLPMEVGDIAFKTNFAYVNPTTNIVERRRVDRDFEKWGIPLCNALDGLKILDKYTIKCKHATEHRCGIVLSGPNLSCNITQNDPLFDNKPLMEVVPLDDSPSNINTANIMNFLSKEISRVLNEHPINVARKKANLPYTNVVLMRGAGERLKCPTFYEKHQLKAFMIAPTAVIAGIGSSVGFDIKIAQGATGYYDTNYISKADTAIKYIDEYDFCFIHIKAVDDTGHDKNLSKRLEMLEKINDMVGYLLNKLKLITTTTSKYAIAITGDHSTPIVFGEHSYEPVPFTLCLVDNLVNEQEHVIMNDMQKELMNLKDNVVRYNEVDCGYGCLGRFTGQDMMSVIKKFKLEVEGIISRHIK